MAKIVFVLFQILIPILLLNMLIAMMGNTYATVIEKSEKEFLKQVLFVSKADILGFLKQVALGSLSRLY